MIIQNGDHEETAYKYELLSYLQRSAELRLNFIQILESDSYEY